MLFFEFRPDVVTRTGVVQPFSAARGPVREARQEPQQFVNAVRPSGPQVVPQPAPEQIAKAAAQVAEKMAEGKPATLKIGTETTTIAPGKPVAPGIATAVAQAAHALANGQPAIIKAQGRAIVAQPTPAQARGRGRAVGRGGYLPARPSVVAPKPGPRPMPRPFPPPMRRDTAIAKFAPRPRPAGVRAQFPAAVQPSRPMFAPSRGVVTAPRPVAPQRPAAGRPQPTARRCPPYCAGRR